MKKYIQNVPMKIREGDSVAKKKKPVEPIKVVEIEEPVENETPVIDVETVDDTKPEMDLDTAPEEVSNDVSDVEDIPQDTPEPALTPTEKTGFAPLVLGGVVAAFLGFMAARSDVIDNFLPPSWRMGSGEIALQEQIDAVNQKLAVLTSGLADTSSLASATEALSVQIGDLSGRLDEVEKRPTSTNTNLSGFGELSEIAQKQQAEIDALLADARLAEEASLEAANKTLARAAATRIIAAIETGAPFDSALADLEATGASEIPAELQAVAANGAVTLAALQNEIPSAARAALAASPIDAEGGVGSFLKRQLGARSTAPREGNDTDAVLSRIEGAVRQGHLTDALAEVETLPEDSQSAMADWIENAKSRLAVTSASETLMQRLAAN